MSDTVRVTIYPRKGASVPVPLPDSSALPTTGAIVDLTEYILGLLRDGELLTYDPLSIGGGPPDYLPIPSGSGGSVSSLTVSALAALASSTQGALSATYGASAVLDGPEGIWVRDPSSTLTADNGLVVGSGTGRWKRVRDRAFINVKWFGAKGDYVADDTAAIQAALNAATTGKILNVYPGCEVYFPPGVYRVSDTLRCKRKVTDGLYNDGEGITIRGANTPGASVASTRLVWVGASTTKQMFWLTGNGFNVSNIKIGADSGKQLYACIESGSDSVSTVSITHNQFRGVVCDGTVGRVDFGILVGLTFPQLGNLENFVFEDCNFVRMYSCGVFINSGQPINTSFLRCHFEGDPSDLRMTGVINKAASTTLHFTDCDFQSQQCGVANSACYALTQFTGGESENCKKLYYCSFNAVGVAGSTIIQGMRLNPSKVGATTALFSSSDHDYIYQVTAGHLVIRDSYFTTGPGDTGYDVKIAFGQSVPVIIENCDFQNANFLAPFADYRGTITGGVWAKGNKYYNGVDAELVSVPNYYGGMNPSGTVTFAAGEATKAIVFPVSEFATDYNVDLSIESAGGTINPDTLNPIPAAKTASGFSIDLPVAPGASSSVTVRYKIWR